jgi:hypothetical protein
VPCVPCVPFFFVCVATMCCPRVSISCVYVVLFLCCPLGVPMLHALCSMLLWFEMNGLN